MGRQKWSNEMGVQEHVWECCDPYRKESDPQGSYIVLYKNPHSEHSRYKDDPFFEGIDFTPGDMNLRNCDFSRWRKHLAGCKDYCRRKVLHLAKKCGYDDYNDDTDVSRLPERVLAKVRTRRWHENPLYLEWQRELSTYRITKS